MARRQRASAHVDGNAAPIAQRLEIAMDHALLAPQREQRTRHLAARGDIRVVMLEIDRRGGAIVLACGVNRSGLQKQALVFGERARIEPLEPAAEPPSMRCR
jgi:hypothetical protein